MPYDLCDRLTVGGLGLVEVAIAVLDLGSTDALLPSDGTVFFSRVLPPLYET